LHSDRCVLVTLAAFFQQGVAAGIANHDFLDVWLEHIVEPSRPAPFFQRHMQLAPQTVQELQHSGCFGFDDGFHHQLAHAVQDCN
jgi:hypothetical protein